MKTSAAVSMSGDPTENLAAIAKAAFDEIGIFERDFIVHGGGPSEVSALIRDVGLEAPLYQPFRSAAQKRLTRPKGVPRR